MRALVWDGKRTEVADDRPEPHPSDGMAVVRVHLAGVCSTDLQILQGYMGFTGVPGHEFVGHVEEGPDGLVGRRVVGEINFGCGACDRCRSGMSRHCPHRRVMGILGADGSFAELVAVPVANLHPVPGGLTDEQAVFTEPLAAAFSILEQVPVAPGADAVVLGDGKLGLLCAQVLRRAGATVTLVGRHDDKLALAAGFGITTVMTERAWRPAQDAAIVVEATGSADGLAAAMAAVRPRGTLVLKSTVAAEHRLSLAPLVIDEVTVVGSRCGLFPPALAALEEGSVAVLPLVEARYPLAEAVEAMAHAARRGARKVLLQCSR
ncbi:MAG: alcohol dehydrogenase catalytic domain-containing protein [Actinomycetota bacterium]